MLREPRHSRQVVHQSQYHVVWCTKYRLKLLGPAESKLLKQVVRDLADETDSVLLTVETDQDHVRILIDVHPQYGIDRFVRLAKGRTSHAIREQFPKTKSRAPSLWTHSWFVSTADKAPLDEIRSYIESQQERPTTRSGRASR